MAYSQVFETVKADTTGVNTVTTDAVDSTGATLLVAWFTGDASSNPVYDPVFTDSAANTWSTKTVSGQGTIYYVAAPSTSASHTFVLATRAPVLMVMGFSGAAASPNDQEAQNITAGNFGTAQSGSITPSEDNCVVIAGFSFENLVAPPTINSGFSTPLFAGSTTFTGSMAYKIQTTAAAVNPTWTFTAAGGQLVAELVSFKAAAAAAGNPWNYYAQQQ